MISSLFALLVASAASVPQYQSSPVYRCRGVQGETVYSGIPCRDRKDLQPEAGDDDAYDRQDGWGGHCPDTAQGLSDRVAAAFDSGNVNDLGVLFLWQAYRSRAAYRHLNELKAMLEKPLAGLELVPARTSTWLDNGPAGPADAESLRVEVAIPGMGDHSATWLFPVVQRDGCYWLQYAESTSTPFP
ncbi:MAG: hypothetical protein WCD66_12825 [Rhodanobacteraceae bacterium]